MEQLFDKYYLPLLDKHYSKTYQLQQENQKYKEKYENAVADYETTMFEKEQLKKDMVKIKEFILQNFYDETKKSFVRNLDDKKIDISLLGAVTPFNVFKAKEKKVMNTVEKINLTLRTYTGGYQRFENDHYMKGNPWVIATLWMANYYIETEEYKKAKECFNFVLRSSGKHGLLAEQINNEKMQPAWIIGLGWSHAMFIIVLQKLIEKGKL